MTPEKFQKVRDVLQAAVQRDVRLIPMNLPQGCPAAWVGGIASDYIGYPRNGQVTLDAVVHTAGHLVLLHCGRIRDGGRFVCTKAHDQQAFLRVLPMFIEQVGELPHPLFSDDEERAADETAAALLARCGCWVEASSLLHPAGGHSFCCLG